MLLMTLSKYVITNKQYMPPRKLKEPGIDPPPKIPRKRKEKTIEHPSEIKVKNNHALKHQNV